MSALPLSESLALARRRGLRFYQLTVDEYNDMIDSGAIKTSCGVELLRGVMVRKDRSGIGDDATAIGSRHNWAVQRLAKLSRNLEPLGYFLNTQGPLVVSSDSEPEPDGCILRGSEDNYVRRKAASADAEVVFEVAESSLQVDRTLKLELYAEGGIPHYVIINLVDGVLEHYALGGVALNEPSYGPATVIGMGQTLTVMLRNGSMLSIPASDLLPVRG